MANIQRVLFGVVFICSLMGVRRVLAQAPLWDYDNTDAWIQDYPQCAGPRQSPIALDTSTSIYQQNRGALKFYHYDELLGSTKILVNNNHSVSFTIPRTVNGFQPYVRTGLFDGLYEVQSLHFHWGSPGVQGSEHTINGRRFDVEMHIVHRNSKYPDNSVATQFPDGLLVLGVMIQGVQKPDATYPGFNSIFNRVPDLYTANETMIRDNLFLGQLLGDLRVKSYFTYNGSLTTPDCSEAVSWYVFSEPLRVQYEQIMRFFQLRTYTGAPLINNFRPLQQRNGRQVFFRSSQVIQNPIVFQFLGRDIQVG